MQPVGIASSAAGQGIGGATTPLLVWMGYWSLAAVLFLLPNNRTSTSVSSAITGMSSGEPSAYSHFLNSFGNQFGSGGAGPRGCSQSPLWSSDSGRSCSGDRRRSSLEEASLRHSSGSAVRVSAASSLAPGQIRTVAL